MRRWVFEVPDWTSKRRRTGPGGRARASPGLSRFRLTLPHTSTAENGGGLVLRSGHRTDPGTVRAPRQAFLVLDASLRPTSRHTAGPRRRRAAFGRCH